MKKPLVFAHVICAQLLKRLAAGCDEVIARYRPWISVRVFITDITGRSRNENHDGICVPDSNLPVLGDTFAPRCNNHGERFKIQSTFDAERISINTAQPENVVTVRRDSCFLWRFEGGGEVQTTRSKIGRASCRERV